MSIAHFISQRDKSPDERRRSRIMAAIIIANVVVIGLVVWFMFGRGHRPPPNIFDTPVDDVSAYLASSDFNALSTEERLEYIQGILKRFQSMNQSDSAVAAAFFAGLSGKASEQLISNARVLGKDILVEGASGFLALQSDAEKGAYIEQWLVKWVRFAEQTGGRDNSSGRSDGELLDRLSRQARRDAERTGEISAVMAQQLMEFWERDVASVASPKEQGQIMAFLPAIRDHMVHRSSGTVGQ